MTYEERIDALKNFKSQLDKLEKLLDNFQKKYDFPKMAHPSRKLRNHNVVK